MSAMSKVQSLEAAIATHVRDGMSIALGCGLESLIPFAASHEIIRQRRKDLTLIGPISDVQFDQLIGAGCVRKIQASWVGNVAAGLGHNFRRAAEHGQPVPLEIEEHSNFTIGLALQAAAMGLPFLPTRSIKGSDIANEPISRACTVHLPAKNSSPCARFDPTSPYFMCNVPTIRATLISGATMASSARPQWPPARSS